MNYALSNFLRCLLGGLVLFLTAGNLIAANSVSMTQSNSNGTSSLNIQVTSIVTVTPGQANVTYTATATTPNLSAPILNGYIGGTLVVSGASGSNTATISVNFSPFGDRYRAALVIESSLGPYVLEYLFQDEPLCPDVAFNYYLPGTDVGGTQYRVVATGNPVNQVLFDGVVAYGAVHHLEGEIEEFCGEIQTEKRRKPVDDADTSTGWAPFNPPTGPPGGPPDSPDGPGPLPTPPDVPEPPDAGADPAPPTPPVIPPSGGGGGDGEIIEWVKDSNGVARGISERADISNEYLRQIRDKAGYMADRLKTIDENTQIVADDVKRKAEAEEAIRDATPDSAEMLGEGSSAAAAATDALGSLAVGTPTISGSPPVFTISMPSQFGGATFDLNPFRADRLGPLCAWLRSFALWLLVVGFAVYAVHQSGDAVRDVAQSQQAKGNAVFAGTGGQATALIAAGLITAVVLSAIVALVAWKDTVIPGSGASVLSFLVGDPFENAPTQVLWMIDQVFPLATACAVLLAKITFRFAVTVTYLAAASIIRFVVP